MRFFTYLLSSFRLIKKVRLSHCFMADLAQLSGLFCWYYLFLRLQYFIKRLVLITLVNAKLSDRSRKKFIYITRVKLMAEHMAVIGEKWLSTLSLNLTGIKNALKGVYKKFVM